MPLPLPNLDDRDYDDLLDETLKVIQKNLDTSWNDLTPGDPGMVLLEAFAFLTEQMIYRLNRLPEKVYTAFLRLLGVTLAPPTAATVTLRFSRDQGSSQAEIAIPRGTRVGPEDADSRPDQPIFITAQEVKLPAPAEGEVANVEVTAHQCERVEEELGVSNGQAGQFFQVQQPSIAARVNDWLDLAVGVESPPGERQSSDWLGSDGLYYRLWREVDNFFGSRARDQVFSVDRQMGTIQFAPAVRKAKADRARQQAKTEQDRPESDFRYLGDIPGNQRRIRIWYYRSLGEAGNLPAEKLTRVLSADDNPALFRVKVTNPGPARGGMDGEPLANALVRGPYEVFTRQNVVTIRDYEAVAKQRNRAIARAHAYALQDKWEHARPGIVEIALVPALPADKRGTEILENLLEAENETRHKDDLDAIQRELMAKAPVGTHSQLTWARYKEVTVEASLVLDDGVRDPDTVYDRINQKLCNLISPFPSDAENNGSQRVGLLPATGWPFGQELRVAQVYQTILAAEPRIKLIDSLELKVKSAPEKDVYSLAADFFQPHTWYAGSGSCVFRSINDGTGWEEILTLETGGAGKLQFHHLKDDQKPERRFEQVAVIRPNPDRPGLVVMATTLKEGISKDGKPSGAYSALYLSEDCGESWYCHTRYFSYEIKDMAWMLRANQPILLLATTCGLYELDIALTEIGQPDLKTETSSTYAVPHLVPVNEHNQQMPLNAVAVLRYRGNSRVAVAAQNRQGVFLSYSDDLIPSSDRWAADSDGQRQAKFVSPNLNGTRSSQELETNFKLLTLKSDDRDSLNVNVDIRCLGVQTDPNHTYIFLWAGAMAIGTWAKGCYRWRFDQLEPHGEGEWISQDSWKGGSCRVLAFVGRRVLAATDSGGVLQADFDPAHWDNHPEWERLDAGHMVKQQSTETEENSKMSLKAQTFFDPLYTLDASPDGLTNGQAIIMTGGPDGIFRQQKGAGGAGDAAFERVSRSKFRMMKDSVTIPFNWLLVSGPHQIGPPGSTSGKSEAKQIKASPE